MRPQLLHICSSPARSIAYKRAEDGDDVFSEGRNGMMDDGTDDACEGARGYSNCAPTTAIK